MMTTHTSAFSILYSVQITLNNRYWDTSDECRRPSSPDVVRFVSILSKPGGVRTSLPVTFPSDGEWLVRVMASEGQFVFGMYRRHMKTISYLGQIDKLYGVSATTRNWNTIIAIVRILKGQAMNKGR